ncbi:MAG TPA: hypothetical protein VFE45_00320 [Coriobacteriia bacterium]|nr:hypothetical protein [Coriobacteriia bacterium]
MSQRNPDTARHDTGLQVALDGCRAALERSRAETRSAFENRALAYAYIYDELGAEDAWLAAGYSAEKTDLLCEIAAAVDEGTFEGAGLDLRFLDRQACAGSAKCLLELRVRVERPGI